MVHHYKTTIEKEKKEKEKKEMERKKKLEKGNSFTSSLNTRQPPKSQLQQQEPPLSAKDVRD